MNVSAETTTDIINEEFVHDYDYDPECTGCVIYEKNQDCSYLDANICCECPCLDCLIKSMCKDGCKDFDKTFWKITPPEEENENKTL